MTLAIPRLRRASPSAQPPFAPFIVPNTKSYEMKGDELSYYVPAWPDGNTPVSIWRRFE